MKESSSSRTLSSLFLTLSLNDFFDSSLSRELGIIFHSLALILEKAFFCISSLQKLLCKSFLKEKNLCCKNGHWTFLYTNYIICNLYTYYVNWRRSSANVVHQFR